MKTHKADPELMLFFDRLFAIKDLAENCPQGDERAVLAEVWEKLDALIKEEK